MAKDLRGTVMMLASMDVVCVVVAVKTGSKTTSVLSAVQSGNSIKWLAVWGTDSASFHGDWGGRGSAGDG